MHRGRNGVVELLRFAFAFMVMMFHSFRTSDPEAVYPFFGGYIAVEFFLMLTGYFTSYNVMKDTDMPPGEYSIKYAAGKYLSWFPAVAVVYVIHYAGLLIMGTVEIKDLSYAFYEIFLMQQSGIYSSFSIMSLWYFSAVALALPVFVYLLKKHSDFFYNILTVLAPLFIYGYICRTHGDLCVWKDFTYITIGVLRAFAGLCMGVNCRKVADIIGSRKIGRTGSNILRICGLIIIAAVFIHTNFSARTAADYYLCMLTAAGLSMIFAAGEPKLPKGVNALCCFLGSLSFPIYCCHWSVRTFLPNIIKKLTGSYDYYKALPLFIAVCIAYGFIIMITDRGIKSLLNKGKVNHDTEI